MPTARLPLDALFPAPQRMPVARVTTRWRIPGVVSEDIVFTSLHEPIEPGFRRRYLTEYAETNTVYARRIRPLSARDRPRLLYLHGYLQPETYVEELALLLSMARTLDVEVVQLQPPYHGRRTPRASRFGGELYWTADVVRSIEALRQNILDARTLLTWLQSEEPRPVGLMGLSLGGALALALTCLDERFAFSIPLIAHMDLAAMVADAPVLENMRRELRSSAGASMISGNSLRTSAGTIWLRSCRPVASSSSRRRTTASSLPPSSRRCGDAGGDRRSTGMLAATWASSPTCSRRWRKSVASSMNGPAGALTNVDPPAPGGARGVAPERAERT